MKEEASKGYNLIAEQIRKQSLKAQIEITHYNSPTWQTKGIRNFATQLHHLKPIS
jgi:hypothetical protein